MPQNRDRKVSTALQVYVALTTSAAQCNSKCSKACEVIFIKGIARTPGRSCTVRPPSQQGEIVMVVSEGFRHAVGLKINFGLLDSLAIVI
jgi:hypothetical protein